MRFFKAFNLLHRRTKSDIFVSGSTSTELEPPSRRYSLPVSLFHSVTFQTFANFKHLNDRGSGGGASVAIPFFGLENELNARLIEANNCWAKEYANLQCQLQECREELHTERQKVQNLQQKLEEDKRIILDLRMSSRRFEGLLGMSNHGASDSPQNTLSGAGVLLNATMPNFSNGSLAVNIRTMDEYSSALQMTLATRKELRNQKKISLFWKRKALDSNELQSAITPSVSTISSVHDPLPPDRQIALDALISRRGLDFSSGGQIGLKDTSSGSRIFIPKLPTYQSADEVCSPIARPAMSFENFLSSRLGPLASESMKAEITSLFGSPDSVKYLIPRKHRELSHSPSLMGKLTKFTFATSTPTKKTNLNVESFGDLHAIFAVRHHMNSSRKVLWLTVILQKTFGVDKLLVDESNGTLNEIDMEDDPGISMASVLPPSTSVPLSSGPPTRTVFQTSNIPTRKGAVTSAGTYNGVTANGPKQGSKDCTSRRSWQSYKARPVTNRVKPVLDGNIPLKHAAGTHNSQGRDKENSFARAIPIFKRKTLLNSTQSNR
jgi:hypothetical protein